MTDTDQAVKRPAMPCKICRTGSGRHPVYSSVDDRAYGWPEGYLCNDCADNAPTSMVEITPEGQEVPGTVPPFTLQSRPPIHSVVVRGNAAMVTPYEPAPRMHFAGPTAFLLIQPDIQPFVDAMEHAIAHLPRITAVPKWLLGVGECQPPRPKTTADRTVSRRRAAGSRRTKRHARRGR